MQTHRANALSWVLMHATDQKREKNVILNLKGVKWGSPFLMRETREGAKALPHTRTHPQSVSARMSACVSCVSAWRACMRVSCVGACVRTWRVYVGELCAFMHN